MSFHGNTVLMQFIYSIVSVGVQLLHYINILAIALGD